MTLYAQFCPVAKAAELVCERWTPLVLRELMLGSSRFAEIQRGVPLMSPTMLSRRLRQLVAAGVVARTGGPRQPRYTLTAAGWELYPVIESLGVWGQRWVRSSYGPDELDPSLLMWDLRRMLRPEGLRDERTVIEIRLREAPPRKQRYWLVVDTQHDPAVDLCLTDPGFDVNLVVDADLRALTQVWMGDRDLRSAMDDGAVALVGPAMLTRRFPTWLGRHPTLGQVQPAGRPGDQPARGGEITAARAASASGSAR